VKLSRFCRLVATLAVPFSILAGAAIPAHASPGACDMRGCAATIHLPDYQGGFGGRTTPNSLAPNPGLRLRVNPEPRVRVDPDKAKVLAF